MADRDQNERQPNTDDPARETSGAPSRDASGSTPRGAGRHAGDYSPNDETRAGHRSFENTSIAADEREQTEERNRVARGDMTDEAGESPDPREGRD